MLPASIRQRLSRYNSSFQAPTTQDSLRSNSHPVYSVVSASEPRMSIYGEPAISPSRPVTADSRDSTPSYSTTTSGSSTPELDRSALGSVYEANSGLKWNRVAPAFNLLRNAGFEAQQPNSDTRLIRNLYIDGLGYLLEALPSDLTSDEARSIQERLPESIKPRITAKSLDDTKFQDRTTGQAPPSYLHRLIATMIVYGFILLQFIIPYASALLQAAYRYEQNHRIAARVLTTALETADGIGKSANEVGSTLLTLGNGRAGAAVINLVAWLIEAVAGGVYDGVGEGLVVLGAIRPNTDLQRRHVSSWT